MRLEWLAAFVFSTLRLSTPLIYAGLAAVISKRAGMLNMALEGMMLVAALTGVVFAGLSGNVFVGLFMAVLFSVLTSLVIAFFNLTGKTDLYLCQPRGFRRYRLCNVSPYGREVDHLCSD